MLKQDPVCGKWLSPTKSHATVCFRGEDYHVCSPLCEAIFKHNPGRQLLDSLRPPVQMATRRELART
ncbi:MAG: YHS domain-containing protein [Gemmatimonadales bacterium]|nr:MAG: YHS domain-containing protein [Gemmatimonadales bacterium]